MNRTLDPFHSSQPCGCDKAGTTVPNLQQGTLSFNKWSRSGLREHEGSRGPEGTGRAGFSGAPPDAGMSLRFETTESARKVIPLSRHREKPSVRCSSIPEWLLCTWHTAGT